MRFLTTEPFRGAPAGRVVILADDDVPSRFLVPLDDAATEALRKAKEVYVEDLAFRMSQFSRTSGLSPWRREELLRVPPIPAQLPREPCPRWISGAPGTRGTGPLIGAEGACTVTLVLATGPRGYN